MKRTILIGALSAAVVASSGCSWVFQNHLPSEYSGRSEPFCSESKALPVLDTAFAVLDVIGTVALAGTADTGAGVALNVASGVAETLLFTSSAITGYRRANECADAKRDYYGSPHGDADAELRTFEKQHGTFVKKPEPPAPDVQPRGFYCVESAVNRTAGFCLRDKAPCEQARSAAVTAVPDLDECKLVESAWCFGDRCAPSEEACDAQRVNAGFNTICGESK